NHHASTRLARLAKDAGVSRFLYASTCSVYGAAGDGLVDESAPLRPLTPYAQSKVRVEDDLLALADDGFVPVFLRNATAFGFSPRLRADIVLNNLVGHAVLDGVVKVLSDGTPWRPLVHAADIAEAFAVCLQAPAGGQHRHRGEQSDGRRDRGGGGGGGAGRAGGDHRGVGGRSALVSGGFREGAPRAGVRGAVEHRRWCGRTVSGVHRAWFDGAGFRGAVRAVGAVAGARRGRGGRRRAAAGQGRCVR